MQDHNVIISRAANGYEIKVRDPDLVKQNEKSDRYVNSMVTYVFTDMAGLTKFLDENLDKVLAVPDDEFGTGFQKALKEG